MRQRLRGGSGEAGFTLVELMVAITLVGTVFVALAHSATGGLVALQAAHQRSVFVELANAELESLRALPFESLGVSSTDASLGTAYPGGMHGGRPAVLLDVAALTSADPGFRSPPAAVSVVTSSPVKGVVVPYTVRRWVTWSGDAGASQIKRISVEVLWSESGRGQRHAVLHSLRYPGGQGPSSGNAAPTADALATPAATVVGATVSFNATSSTDTDGTIVSYHWQFGDGGTGSGSTPTHSYAVVGNFTAVLTVTDDAGATSVDSVDVRVLSAANAPPVAGFTVSATTGVAPFTVNVDAAGSCHTITGSYDPLPECTSLQYHWAWGDGTAAGSGVSATHNFASAGTYRITLTVTDGAGLQDDAFIDVTASPLNCLITSAWFKNPSTNAVSNFILVKNASGQLENSGFKFTATTNTGCSSMAVSIPNISGSLSLVSDDGTTRTWELATTSTERFAIGEDQSGSFTGNGGASFPITLDVRR